jgi:branched-chain amino acid transport system permease protein
MAIGAYTSSLLTLRFNPPGTVAGHFVFILALLAGSIAAAVVGLAVGLPSLRLRGDYLAIVTLASNQIIKCVIQNLEPLGAQRGLGGMVQYTGFFITFLGVAVTLLVIYNLVHSTYGRGFLAVHDDEIAAEAVGIDTTRYKITAFMIGAFFAGTAGGLYAHFKQFIHPERFTFIQSMDIVVMVILGGMGNLLGVCLAAVLLTVLPEALRYVAHLEWLPGWLRQVAENRMILYSLLLIVLMLARPQGLFNFRLPFTKKNSPS